MVAHLSVGADEVVEARVDDLAPPLAAENPVVPALRRGEMLFLRCSNPAAEAQRRLGLAAPRNVVELAEAGLERRAFMNKDGTKDERMHLARLHDLVSHGECPADRLLAGLTGDPRAEIMARADLRPAS